MVREFHLESRDPIRFLKKKIEELRDEECPIVGLPGSGASHESTKARNGAERKSTDSTDYTDGPGQELRTKNQERLGPGYTWVHDPSSVWGRRVIERFDLDIGHRIREMVRHRAVLTGMTVDQAQTELFGGVRSEE